MAADTPKHWKQYEAYIRDHNRSMSESIDKRRIEDKAEYDARPWYMKILKGDPTEANWGVDYMYFDKEPSLLDYYHWDTHIRK